MQRNDSQRVARWSACRIALVIASVAAWAGCSVEKNYEILSFFFDGVPEPGGPEAPAGGGTGTRRGASPGPTVSWHQAYLDRRCAECHGESVRFGFTTSGFDSLQETNCVECHTDAVQDISLHGPVAAGACLFCHDAHSSPYPALLVDEAITLCTACHDAATQGALSLPTHAEERNCLDCHFGHGGDSRPYLRPPMLSLQAGDSDTDRSARAP